MPFRLYIGKNKRHCSQHKASLQFGMHIWDRSSREILSLLISSTAHKYYFTEIQDATGLHPGTVTAILGRLTQTEVLIREEERHLSESEWRAPRVYYSLNPDVIDYLRL